MIDTPRFDDIRFTAVDELRALLSAVDADSVGHLVTALDGAPRVFCAGAGRSGLAMRAFTMRLMHMGISAYAVGDVTTPALQARELLVVGSGSGATGSLVSMAEKARGLGGAIALATIEPQSPIGRIADIVVRIPAPSPKAQAGAAGGATVSSVQPMASLFEQGLWILLDAVILLLMKGRGTTSAAMFTRHANLE